jgi:hypothetical protein
VLMVLIGVVGVVPKADLAWPVRHEAIIGARSVVARTDPDTETADSVLYAGFQKIVAVGSQRVRAEWRQPSPVGQQGLRRDGSAWDGPELGDRLARARDRDVLPAGRAVDHVAGLVT